MELKKKEDSTLLIYNEVLYLSQLLTKISILKFEEEIRKDVFLLKKSLINGVQDFEEERTFILLMNGGVEKTDQQGSTYFDEPKYETRTTFKGTDEEYKTYLLTTIKLKRKLFNEIIDLGERISKVKVIPFMTKVQFDNLLEIVGNSEFEQLQSKLVKI